MDEASPGGIRRLARPAPPLAPPTPARALRQALSRAADQTCGLVVVVLGVAEETASLDEVLGRLEPDLLFLSVQRGGGPVGLFALDLEARAALVETQTLGRPLAQSPEPRPPTAVDAALAAPLGQAFLREAADETIGTPLDGWIGDARVAGPVPSTRDAALLLADGSYRVVRLTLDLGGGGRQGLAILLLPASARPANRPGPSVWRGGLSRQVLGAEVAVTAVLHCLRTTLGEAEALAPGSILPLPGVTVASVRLVGPGGEEMGPARLGQVAGMRAVRIERPAPLALAAALSSTPWVGAAPLEDDVPGPWSMPQPWEGEEAAGWPEAPVE